MSQRLFGGVVLLVCGLGLGGIGCETGMDQMMAPASGGTEPAPPAEEPAPPELPEPPEPSAFGVWRMTAGSILIDLDSYESSFLVLNEDGTGQWTLRHVATNALLRIDLLHVLVGDSLQIAYLGLGSGIGAEYTVVLDDFDTMRLAGRESTPPGLVDGRIATFVREAELPEEFRMRTLEVLRRFDGLSRPVSLNDLVFDGTSLIYQTPDEGFGASQRIDPDTGAVLETFTSFAGAQHIQTMQDGGFWTHCGCGGVNDARLTDGSVSDTFDTADLGDEIQIRAMAFDSVGRVLWVHGSGRMLMVDADAEPDVLLDSNTFDVGFITGLAFDGTDLWAIQDSLGTPEALVILRIDATTLEVVETYRSPDANVEWMGIVFVGKQMFLLGEDAASEGVIAEVTQAS